MSRRAVVLLVLLAGAALGVVAWLAGVGAGGDETGDVGEPGVTPGDPSKPGEAGAATENEGADESGSTEPEPVPPQDDLMPRLAFLGDSLTYGIGAPAGEGFPWRTAELLGWSLTVVDGVPGSGYLAAGLGEPMPARVDGVVAAAPDVVVVVGGNNDIFQGYDADAVGRAASELLGGLRTGLPDADLVVVGPFPNLRDDPAERAEVSDAAHRAADDVGAVWLDPEELLAEPLGEPGAWERHLSEDGLHPNAAGYRLIAEALTPRLADLAAQPQR